MPSCMAALTGRNAANCERNGCFHAVLYGQCMLSCDKSNKYPIIIISSILRVFRGTSSILRVSMGKSNF